VWREWREIKRKGMKSYIERFTDKETVTKNKDRYVKRKGFYKKTESVRGKRKRKRQIQAQRGK